MVFKSNFGENSTQKKIKNMKQIIAVFALLFTIQFAFSQNDEQLIRETLNNYIEGSTNGKPDLLK